VRVSHGASSFFEIAFKVFKRDVRAALCEPLTREVKALDVLVTKEGVARIPNSIKTTANPHEKLGRRSISDGVFT
jgi:hypothetical protein